MNLLYLNLCRLCAGSCENSVPIFEKTGILNFAEKIKSYLHVEIKNSNNGNDEPRMCNACYDKLINWDQYAEQVQKVQGMFSSLSDLSDTNKVMNDSNQKVNGTNEKVKCDRIPNEQSVIQESGEGKMTETIFLKEKKKSKQKKIKKEKKSESQIPKKESDFSEEDEIPLAGQIETDAFINRLKDKETKKVKPKIKLKIKPLKQEREEKKENESYDNWKEVEDSEEFELKIEEKEEEEEDEEDREENTVTTPGIQSLFSWECLECHTPVKNWNALVKHCRESHESNASVQCVCGKILQSRASIMKHRMKHTVGYGYKCEFENCNKTFHRQQLLDVHSLSHMPKELQPWMCCKCSRRFHTESLLKQHEKVHLPKEEKLIHPCEVCQKKFCSKSAVSAHIRAVHFGERPFVCDQCGHSFTSKGILHEHLTIHSDVYNFHCKDCNKSFKTKYRLKIHMDTHVETRYQCPFCTLTLNTRRTLRMHLLVHRDEKAFQCTTCGKAFKRSKDLKNHYNLHTGRRPYTCPFCQRTFANGSNCRSHKRRMHPEELRMYEAALAAGQQPMVFRNGGEEQEDFGKPVQGSRSVHFFDDSSESKSDVSELKKFSDEDDKPVALVPYNGKDDKLLSPSSAPLNLQRNYRRIKQEEDEEPEMTLDGGISHANMTQITFASHNQNVQNPIENLYTFQSSGIPAFPGNPFFRP